jgi:predicted kinase
VVLRSDVIRKKMFGVAETTPLSAGAYQQDVTHEVYDRLATVAAQILKCGLSVVADAAFLREHERDAIFRAATAGGARFDGLFLQADLPTRLARIAGRVGDASDATADVARQQEQYDLGALKDWAPLDASGSPEKTLAGAIAALSISIDAYEK